jgi:hypothetical protein
MVIKVLIARPEMTNVKRQMSNDKWIALWRFQEDAARFDTDTVHLNY